MHAEGTRKYTPTIVLDECKVLFMAKESELFKLFKLFTINIVP